MARIRKPNICGICLEAKTPLKETMYKKKHWWLKCSKPHSFCEECITRYINRNILNKTALIRCPCLGGKSILDPFKCRSLVSRHYFVEWCTLSVDGWITGKGYKRAVCPYEGCSEVVIDECKRGGRQECPRCKGEFCFDCGVKWETNHHEKCKREEVVFMNAAKEGNLKRCPNCRFFVQRKSGCRNVLCRCGTSFCHKCGVDRCNCWLPELFADIYGRIRHLVSSAYFGCFS